MRQDALDPVRRAEFTRAAKLSPPSSPAEGLRQLWDLLDVLTALSGPLPVNRTVTRISRSIW